MAAQYPPQTPLQPTPPGFPHGPPVGVRPAKKQSSTWIWLLVIGLVLMFFVGPMALCAISVCFPLAFGAMFAMFAGSQEPPGGPHELIPPPEKPAVSLVLPSMESADPMETITRFTEKVRAEWSGDAELGYVVLQGVDSNGKVDATSTDGMIMMQFFDSYKLRQAGDAEVRIREAKLEVVIAGGEVSEFTMDVPAVEAESIKLIKQLPSCDIRTLWKKAQELGYPPGGPANIFFPQLPQGFFDKDKDDPKGFYSYVFAIPGHDARDLPVFFNIKDCYPYDFKDLQIIYKGPVEEDKEEEKKEEKKGRKKKGKNKTQ